MNFPQSEKFFCFDVHIKKQYAHSQYQILTLTNQSLFQGWDKAVGSEVGA